MSRPPLEVADLIRTAGTAFLERNRRWLRWKHVKVLLAIARCRTAALGGHLDECTRCGHRAISYNSCRNRHCPKCQISPRERWIAARQSARRGATLTRQLLAFGRRQVLEPKVLNINLVLADVEKLLQRVIGEDIELDFQIASTLGNVKADPGQLEQVVVNLAANARDAMLGGGKPTIATSNVELDEAYADRRLVVGPGRYVQLVVTDTGCGMDKETQSHIFEPFFTTKEQGKGTGLGLATVYGIAKQSGGYIWVYSEPGHGTEFKIYLPMVEAAAEAPRHVERIQELPHGSETILVVEDDASLREVTCEFLRSGGYAVIAAESAEEALRLGESHNAPIDVLLTDVIMPKMNGRELATRLIKALPEMKVLYVSGYADGIVRDGVNAPLEEGLAFLQKPYTRNAVMRKLREILDSQRVKSVANKR